MLVVMDCILLLEPNLMTICELFLVKKLYENCSLKIQWPQVCFKPVTNISQFPIDLFYKISSIWAGDD